jgi:hypothetical protein
VLPLTRQLEAAPKLSEQSFASWIGVVKILMLSGSQDRHGVLALR